MATAQRITQPKKENVQMTKLMTYSIRQENDQEVTLITAKNRYDIFSQFALYCRSNGYTQQFLNAGQGKISYDFVGYATPGMINRLYIVKVK